MSHVFLIAPLLRQFGVGLPIYLTISCLWPALWRILLAIFSKNFKSQLGNHWIISAMFIFTSIWKVHQLVEHEGLTVPVDRVCSDYKAHVSFIDYGSDHEIFKRLQVPFNLRRAPHIHTVHWQKIAQNVSQCDVIFLFPYQLPTNSIKELHIKICSHYLE